MEKSFHPRNKRGGDLAQIQSLGANVLRIYYVPPRWFLDLLAEHGLKVLVDIPWAKHLCFLDSAASQAEARRQVRDAVSSCKGHPGVNRFCLVHQFIDETLDALDAALTRSLVHRESGSARPSTMPS